MMLARSTPSLTNRVGIKFGHSKLLFAALQQPLPVLLAQVRAVSGASALLMHDRLYASAQPFRPNKADSAWTSQSNWRCTPTSDIHLIPTNCPLQVVGRCLFLLDGLVQYITYEILAKSFIVRFPK